MTTLQIHDNTGIFAAVNAASFVSDSKLYSFIFVVAVADSFLAASQDYVFTDGDDIPIR